MDRNGMDTKLSKDVTIGTESVLPSTGGILSGHWKQPTLLCSLVQLTIKAQNI